MRKKRKDTIRLEDCRVLVTDRKTRVARQCRNRSADGPVCIMHGTMLDCDDLAAHEVRYVGEPADDKAAV